MHRPPLFLGALLASSVLAACAAAAPDPGPDDAGSTAATAIVAVERTVGPGDTVRGDTVLARFVRVRQGAVDDAALRVVGIAADVPAPGACAAPTESASASLAGRGVELLDVGQVTVASAVLLPRTMPDPALPRPIRPKRLAARGRAASRSKQLGRRSSRRSRTAPRSRRAKRPASPKPRRVWT